MHVMGGSLAHGGQPPWRVPTWTRHTPDLDPPPPSRQQTYGSGGHFQWSPEKLDEGWFRDNTDMLEVVFWGQRVWNTLLAKSSPV